MKKFSKLLVVLLTLSLLCAATVVAISANGVADTVTYYDNGNVECTLEEAVTQLKTNTRRFAKRQLTWFRRQIEGRWVDLGKETGEEVMENVLEYLKQQEVL